MKDASPNGYKNQIVKELLGTDGKNHEYKVTTWWYPANDSAFAVNTENLPPTYYSQMREREGLNPLRFKVWNIPALPVASGDPIFTSWNDSMGVVEEIPPLAEDDDIFIVADADKKGGAVFAKREDGRRLADFRGLQGRRRSGDGVWRVAGGDLPENGLQEQAGADLHRAERGFWEQGNGHSLLPLSCAVLFRGNRIFRRWRAFPAGMVCHTEKRRGRSQPRDAQDDNERRAAAAGVKILPCHTASTGRICVERGEQQT